MAQSYWIDNGKFEQAMNFNVQKYKGEEYLTFWTKTKKHTKPKKHAKDSKNPETPKKPKKPKKSKKSYVMVGACYPFRILKCTV